MINDTIKKPPAEEPKTILLSDVMKKSGSKRLKIPTEFSVDDQLSFKKIQQMKKDFRKNKIIR